jgi:hypothetical protein
MKQIELACALQGRPLDSGNMTTECGPKWAIHKTRQIQAIEFFVRGDAKLREAMTQHNAEAHALGGGTRGIWQWRAEWFRWAPDDDDLALHHIRLENQKARRAAAREKLKHLALVESMRGFGPSEATEDEN